jgi:uncharacterized membrane protein
MSSRSSSLTGHRLPLGYAAAMAAVLIVGSYLAGLLVVLKLQLLFDPGFESSCNLSATLNCDAVQTSKYAEFFGRPLSLIGFGTYITLLALLLLARRSRRLGAAFCQLIVVAGFAMCVFSVYLALVSTFIIEAYCIYCIGMYAVTVRTGLSR